MTRERQWQLDLNSSNSWGSTGRGRAPRRLRQGSCRGQAWLWNQTATSLGPLTSCAPEARLFQNLCFLHRCKFLPRGSPGESWNSAPQDPSLSRPTDSISRPTPSAAKPLSRPVWDAAEDACHPTSRQSPASRGQKLLLSLAQVELWSPCEGLPAVLLPAEVLTNTQSARVEAQAAPALETPRRR